jgi:hypothetical protein
MKTQVSVKSVWNGKDVKIKGKKVVGKTSYEVGLVVEGQAKLLAPVMFGYLAASITTQSKDNGTKVENPSKYAARSDWANSKIGNDFTEIEKPKEDNIILVGTPVSYAPYQEFLNRPFLRPSLDLAQGKAVTIGEVNGRLELKEYLK